MGTLEHLSNADAVWSGTVLGEIVFKAIEPNVRFGSQADICSAKGHVRFTPDSDRESGHVPQMVMSALPPKADMCSANRHVCSGPKADIGSTSDEHSDAWQDDPDLGEPARLRIDLD
jgi:hypothetical protein